MKPADTIRAELTRIARELGAPAEVEPALERPRDPAFGDWSTNLAMVLARPLKRKPREIADDIRERFEHDDGHIATVEIAGPGFLNFRLHAGTIAAALPEIIAAGDRFGRTDTGGEQPVVVEFVSANPTGPLHVGHGRQAALGDAIATLLEWTGWKVSREFYYNDAGAQIANLALSVQARTREARGEAASIPEGGYHGEYIRDIASSYEGSTDDLQAIGAHAVRALRREQDADLAAFGVGFDTYYLESSLYEDGRVEQTVQRLIATEKAYEHEGALWLRTTEFGDDKDRVMRKSDGTYTYFVPDVAYHVTKWERGFKRAVNVQGADHHSTVTRVRAGLQALGIGIPPDYPEYVLHQLVTVTRGGEEVKISKRAGSYVTVRDLLDEVGRDAVRYFFLMRKGESHLEFDLELARKQSEENPVYYIQMAHARMCGIFRVGGEEAAGVAPNQAELSALSEPEERELIKALADFPPLLEGAAAALEPHRIAGYLLETSRLAHTWYHKHHVLGEPEPVRSARLVLARATQVVLASGLAVLGITAPERM
ncbi:arginine--tRNA ligase [soil metagenome]